MCLATNGLEAGDQCSTVAAGNSIQQRGEVWLTPTHYEQCGGGDSGMDMRASSVALQPSKVSLYAGVGIVTGSDAMSEWLVSFTSPRSFSLAFTNKEMRCH